MNDVTLRQWEHFLAVAEHGSLSLAAERAHISQPGLSLAIDQLEHALGVQLLVRRRAKGVVLTTAGTRAVAHARALLASAEEVKAVIRSEQDELAGPLRVGFFSTLVPTLLPGVLERFVTEHPKVDFDFIEGPGTELLEKMRLGLVEAVVTYSLHLTNQKNFVNLKKVWPRVVLGTNHPLASKEQLHFSDLVNYEAVLLSVQPTGALVEAMFHHADFVPHVRWRVSQAETARSIVARGLAYSFLIYDPPLRTSLEGGKLIYRDVEDTMPKNAVTLVRPDGAKTTAKQRRLQEILREELHKGRP